MTSSRIYVLIIKDVLTCMLNASDLKHKIRNVKTPQIDSLYVSYDTHHHKTIQVVYTPDERRVEITGYNVEVDSPNCISYAGVIKPSRLYSYEHIARWLLEVDNQHTQESKTDSYDVF